MLKNKGRVSKMKALRLEGNEPKYSKANASE